MSTILLVEDNPHIMKINAEALTMYGYEILQAATARECRQALRWHPVDLVVLDCIGFTQKMKEMFAEKTGKTVVLPRTLLARVISEVTDV